MTSLLQFASKSGRARSLLALYVLHSLDKSEKSGYDIMREIEKLTSGAWVPSKGTLYPLLHQLETEGLIVPAPEKEGSGPVPGLCSPVPGGTRSKRSGPTAKSTTKKWISTGISSPRSSGNSGAREWMSSLK